MNDKFFACTTRGGSHSKLNRLEKDEHVPVFGERRSPSCVEDWLEINDFDCVPAPIDSPIKLKIPANLPKNTLTIKTRFLQRQNSFHSSDGSSGRTVKSIIESFSKANDLENVAIEGSSRMFSNPTSSVLLSKKLGIQAPKHFTSSLVQNKPSRLSRSAFVSVPNRNISSRENSITIFGKESLLSAPRITSTIPKIQTSSTETLHVTSPSVIASLKPTRRKKRQAPRAEDIYTNSKEKHKILQALSNIDIRSSDDNYDVVIDSFSLEGEFV